MAPSADARGRVIARLDVVGLAASAGAVVLLLAFLIGSLLLTGGQVAPDQAPPYDQVMEWPVFQPPAWISVGIGAIALLTFAPMAALVRPQEASRLVRAINFTVAGPLLQSLAMLWAFPIELDGGLPGRPVTQPDLYWVGAALAGLTIVLVLVLGLRAMIEHDRRRRA